MTALCDRQQSIALSGREIPGDKNRAGAVPIKTVSCFYATRATVGTVNAADHVFAYTSQSLNVMNSSLARQP